MRLVRQAPGSNHCGQACIATLGQLTLEAAIELVGTRGKTATRHLKAALGKLGIKCGDRRVRGMPDKDETALLFWKDGGTKGHWTVWHKGKYYDPLAGVFRKVPRWLENSRVTSHLKVELNATQDMSTM